MYQVEIKYMKTGNIQCVASKQCIIGQPAGQRNKKNTVKWELKIKNIQTWNAEKSNSQTRISGQKCLSEKGL